MDENTEPWDKGLPDHLIPAIKSLRETFDEAHWKCGRITQVLCYAQLHKGTVDEDIREYIEPLKQLKAIVGPPATRNFNELLKKRTPPAIFKAFYDLYLGGMGVQAVALFTEMVEIGRANEQRPGTPHLEWATLQTRQVIRHYAHRIETWVRDVCDKHVYDPNEDMEEQIFWRKWKAPLLLIMKPSRFQTYQPERAWARRDPETSSQWLKRFAEDYVRHLEIQLDRVAGKAALELAKQSRPVQNTTVDNNPQQKGIQTKADGRYTPTNARREARKLDTQDMYKSWQKEYQVLKRRRPDMSDVWYSQQIARLEIARSSSAETIRKHMKK